MEEKYRARAALVGAIAAGFVDRGLQVSGLQNIWSAFLCWGVAAALGIYWLKLVTTHSIIARKIFVSVLTFGACVAFVVGCSWLASGRDWKVATALFYSPSMERGNNPNTLPRLADLFETDFLGKGAGGVQILVNSGQEIIFKNKSDGQEQERVWINYKIDKDFGSNSSFLIVYIPKTERTFDTCVFVGLHAREWMQFSLGNWEIGNATGPSGRENDLVFTGKVYIYHETSMTLSQLGHLEDAFHEAGLRPEFRSTPYALNVQMSHNGSK